MPRAGVSNSGVPTGLKVLLPAAALYTVKRICTVLNKVTPTVALKNPANDVIVPARGATNAKLETVRLKEIVPAATLTPGNELPNPSKAPVFAKPPKTVTNATGPPDANGIMADDPVGPVIP
ncbi:hypothetical protein ND00_26640 [Clostridium sp. L74]|nr:hypothetical protein ND00_26640 [Clostridium sp. L74]